MITFTMRQLFENGVHYGHTTQRWNPKMKPFLFGKRSGIHIINLDETYPMLTQALMKLRDTVAEGGRILFVGTKRQAQDVVRTVAEKTGQYYVNHRWLGGMLTNWDTVSKSIKRLKELEKTFEQGIENLTKKEILTLERQKDKLSRTLGGIKEMGGVPELLVVFDTNREAIAISEANVLGIPVVAIIDSNSNPDNIEYPIPGNDDAIRALTLYGDLAMAAILEGLTQSFKDGGGDIGEAETLEKSPLAEHTSSEQEKPFDMTATADITSQNLVEEEGKGEGENTSVGKSQGENEPVNKGEKNQETVKKETFATVPSEKKTEGDTIESANSSIKAEKIVPSK